MDTDDLDPKRPTLNAPNLESMGLDELQAYIAALQAEIARAQSAIAAKQRQQTTAASLFKW